MSVHALRDDWLMPMGPSVVVAPSAWPQALAAIAAAVAAAKGIAAPVESREAGDAAKAIATALSSGERKAVLLGNAAAQHPDAAQLERLARWIAEQTGATLRLARRRRAMRSARSWSAPCQGQGGLSAAPMLGADATLKACVLLNVEPALDCADGRGRDGRARQGRDGGLARRLQAAPDDDCADVLLPIAPFTETSGTFVNAEGRVQSFHGVVKPLGDARPAWKVLRVLGNLLGLAGFGFETSEEVRAEALGDVARSPHGCLRSAPPTAAR